MPDNVNGMETRSSQWSFSLRNANPITADHTILDWNIAEIDFTVNDCKRLSLCNISYVNKSVINLPTASPIGSRSYAWYAQVIAVIAPHAYSQRNGKNFGYKSPFFCIVLIISDFGYPFCCQFKINIYKIGKLKQGDQVSIKINGELITDCILTCNNKSA